MVYHFFHRLFHIIWSIFISGLLTILPLTLTIALFNVSFKLLASWLEPVAYLKPSFLNNVPHAEIILVILFVLLVGTILNLFMIRSIVHIVEESIGRIPIIRPVYTGIRQLVKAFGSQDKESFKSVVLVEFPRKGAYSVGFLTSDFPTHLNGNESHYVNVFIPTTPNPTSGFLIIVPHADIKIIDLTRQEAMALIISGGIIVPEKFNQK